MELMDESLTRFLEQSQDPLPYHTQVNLCHDVTLALAYLHTSGIIHRDLSSNNVLLIAGTKAKVADFGMSKLLNVAPTITPLPLTHCPGTQVYMPPQALRKPPVYSEKLDCFSFGILSIQTMTHQFPNPGPARKIIEDPRYHGGLEAFVPENERRKSHIDRIDPTHPLLPTSLNCLSYNEEDLPSAQILCHQLAALKETPHYNHSVQQAQGRVIPEQSVSVDEMARKDRQITELQQQYRVDVQQIQNLQRQLQKKDDAIAMRQREILQIQQEVAQQLQEKDHTIEMRERQLRELNQQLQENEEVTAELQQMFLQCKESLISVRDREIQELRQQLRSNLDDRVQEQSQPERIRLSWTECAKPPSGLYMIRRTATASDGSVAYFSTSVNLRDGTNSVYSYDSEQDQWSELPPCKYCNFSMAVVNGLLTTIGGQTSRLRPMRSSIPSGHLTNKLFSLSSTSRDRKWKEVFPSRILCAPGSFDWKRMGWRSLAAQGSSSHIALQTET